MLNTCQVIKSFIIQLLLFRVFLIKIFKFFYNYQIIKNKVMLYTVTHLASV